MFQVEDLAAGVGGFRKYARSSRESADEHPASRRSWVFLLVMRIVIIDNYDSFTYNLVQALGELGHELRVFRHDRVKGDEIADLRPDKIVISPGPGRPRDAGISMEVIRRFGPSTWVLGVCLGHQCLAEAFGGKVVHAPRVMHGKTSRVAHDGRGIHAGVANPFVAMRYHSLAVEEKSLPSCLKVTARAEDGVIMGLRHTDQKLVGVQYHPESFLTPEGKRILQNFIRLDS